MKNAINWFEIPTEHLDRATRFYEALYGKPFEPMNMPNIKMRLFPVEGHAADTVGGALVHSGSFHKPSATDGPLVYLNANPDLQLFLDNVEVSGGQILVGKTQISPDHGYMEVILDTEGNRIAFHSNS